MRYNRSKITKSQPDLINIAPDGSAGEVFELEEFMGLKIQVPVPPATEDIDGYSLPQEEQVFRRPVLPEVITGLSSQDEWDALPRDVRDKYRHLIEREFDRRTNGYWFMNDGEATWLTGQNYITLVHSKFDSGIPQYYEFQRDLHYHMEACFQDSRCMGQLFVKCRRSGYTNVAAAVCVNEAVQVKDAHVGMQSKTGPDAQSVFMSKVVPCFKHYPWFFKPMMDGSTNPRMELAFREPSKKITKNNKVAKSTDALNTIITWKNTVNNAYDSQRLHVLFLDEAGKLERPHDIMEFWRIERTCLLRGSKIIGKALVGSTVNPLDKGGANYRKMWENSDVVERNANGRTASGLYRIFIPAYKALEGFIDRYGKAVIDDPVEPVLGIDGEWIDMGAKTFLLNERDAMKNDAKELNEIVRQFPFSPEEAFRDSIEGSLFNVAKIYQQLEHNMMLYPEPTVTGNFAWKDGKKDTEVLFHPDPKGRWTVSWMPPKDMRSKLDVSRGSFVPANPNVGCGGVDSYDLDQTTDGRGSKGACHIYNKFNMNHPSNQFVAEYCSRPPMANIFYEDILMASVFYGYPILIENNKYGIARYFEQRGYSKFLLDRPEHLGGAASKSKTKGIPSNSKDVLQAHAQAIEDYIHRFVGMNEDGEMGVMAFDRTLDDWIGFDINNRTKFDLTISAGLALLAAQKYEVKKFKKEKATPKQFFRRYGTGSDGKPFTIR